MGTCCALPAGICSVGDMYQHNCRQKLQGLLLVITKEVSKDLMESRDCHKAAGTAAEHLFMSKNLLQDRKASNASLRRRIRSMVRE
jgi:hypothetical protein